MATWPEAVQRVTTFLAESGAEVRVEEFPVGTHTAEQAADAIGCTLPEIVKSLVFEGGGRSVVALVPGDRRADTGKVAAALKTDPRVAKCMTEKMFIYALGRGPTIEDRRCGLPKIEREFVAGGHRLEQLAIRIVSSPAFTSRRAEGN